MSSSSCPRRDHERSCREQAGFTLLEVMIVCLIVAVLAALAVPNYADSIRRGKIIEATSALSDARQRTEQWFLDNRTYAGGCAAAIVEAQKTVRAFTLTCPAPADPVTQYTIQAAGAAAENMTGFTYTIDQDNVRRTTAVGAGWGGAPKACWITKKDGTCS
jgi:type IV pilus assembly protein PilE